MVSFYSWCCSNKLIIHFSFSFWVTFDCVKAELSLNEFIDFSLQMFHESLQSGQNIHYANANMCLPNPFSFSFNKIGSPNEESKSAKRSSNSIDVAKPLKRLLCIPIHRMLESYTSISASSHQKSDCSHCLPHHCQCSLFQNDKWSVNHHSVWSLKPCHTAMTRSQLHCQLSNSHYKIVIVALCLSHIISIQLQSIL